jgi:hypothetical protein
MTFAKMADVEWADRLLTTPDGKWNNEIPPQSTFWRKTERTPMVS